MTTEIMINDAFYIVGYNYHPAEPQTYDYQGCDEEYLPHTIWDDKGMNVTHVIKDFDLLEKITELVEQEGKCEDRVL